MKRKRVEVGEVAARIWQLADSRTVGEIESRVVSEAGGGEVIKEMRRLERAEKKPTYM